MQPEEEAARDDAPVDMAQIDARIRALRREVNKLRAGQLSAKTVEAVVLDLHDIWEWCAQLVREYQRTRDELYTMSAAVRDLAHQQRATNALLERRSDRRVRWKLLVRERGGEAAPPLADLRFGREAEPPGEPGREGVGGPGEGAQVQPGDGEA